MKNPIPLSIILMLAMIGLKAQQLPRQVISTAGGHSTSGSVILSWTVGQAGPVDALTPAAFYITQGFQQGDELWVSIKNHPNLYDAIKVYPNPSSGIFKLEGVLPVAGDYGYSIVNISGAQVLSGTATTSNDARMDQTIDLGNFAAGYYALIIQGGTADNAFTCVTKLSLVK